MKILLDENFPLPLYHRLRAEYWARKQVLCEALCHAGLSWYEPGGSYFLWCEYGRLSTEDDTVFCDRLLREAGVAGVAGSVFYPHSTANPRRLRFTFSKSRATIEEAARRLSNWRRS